MKKQMRQIAAILAALAMMVGLSACGDSDISMPNLVGQDLTKAEATLRDKGFTDIQAEDGSGQVALDGTVTEQDPKAGKKVDEYDLPTVHLTVRSSTDAANEQAEKDQAKTDRINELATSLKGKDAKDAIKQLKDEGLLGTITNAKGMDVSESEISHDGAHWVVANTVKHTIVSQSIDLIVDTQDNVDKDKAVDAQKEELSKKLSTSAALDACREYGKRKYPYGFKTHDIVGILQDFTPKDANTWYYKATVDITNEYGATEKGKNYECYVTGTTANPQVTNFLVY